MKKNKKNENFNLDNKVAYCVNIAHSKEVEIIVVEKDYDFKKSEFVIVDTRYGKDICSVCGKIKDLDKINKKNICSFIRKAEDKDIEKWENNKKKEKKAVVFCREKVSSLKLDMKIVSAHFLTNDNKLVFFFTSDNRVDFRELVKDLIAEFKTRIELRQIGVRDEARQVSGLSVCGRAVCCGVVSDNLKSVSIKMAKEQNLSLNSSKISGSCGRLLCCLAYENDFYKEAKKGYPAVGTIIRKGDVSYKVFDVNVINSTVKLYGNDGQVLNINRKSMRYNDLKKKWDFKL